MHPILADARRAFLPVVLAALLALAGSLPVAASPGDPDTTFGSNGILRAGHDGSGEATGVGTQSDGKIVVAGTATSGDKTGFCLMRYRSDGSRDDTFGTNGSTLTSFGWSYATARCIAIQADDRILVGGDADARLALARYLPNGALDGRFGSGGRITLGGTGGLAGYDFQGNAMTLQPDGKILLAGTLSDGLTGPHLCVARFNADGSLDTSFAGDGVASTESFLESRANAVTLQQNGRIVAAGRALDLEGTRSIVVVRYLASGQPDASFGVAGVAVTVLGADAAAFAVTMQNPLTGPSKIVVAGSTTYSYMLQTETAMVLARYNDNGSPDLAFGTNGVVISAIGSDDPGFDAVARAVMVQYSGATPVRIVVAGHARVSPDDAAFAVVRYTLSGALDTTFDGDGAVTALVGPEAPLGPDDDRGLALARGAGGRFIVAGRSSGDFACLRLNSDGSLDTSFDGDARRTDDVGAYPSAGHGAVLQPDGRIVTVGRLFDILRCRPDGRPDTTFGGDGFAIPPTLVGGESNCVALQPDGRIVSAGHFWNGVDSTVAVARCLVDGSPDPSFSSDGSLITDPGLGSSRARDVVIQPDGKILVAGSSESPLGEVMLVIRYLPNGVLDFTFGTNGVVMVGTGAAAGAEALALQADGKICLAGFCNLGASDDFCVVRLLPSGALDTNFGLNGRALLDASGAADRARDLVVQPDGRLVVVGVAAHGMTNDLAVARFTPSGQPDVAFSGDGVVTLPFGADNDGGVGVAVGPDGRILVADRIDPSTPDPGDDFVLVRLTPGGAVDTSFGSNGIATLDFGGGQPDYAGGLVLDAEGRAVVTGASGGLLAVARVLGDGAPSGVADTAPAPGKPTLRVGFPFPNPTFRDATLRFWTSTPGAVSALVVDVSGRRVRLLADGTTLAPGDQTLRWDGLDDSGRPAASGIYQVRLVVGGATEVRRIALFR